MNTTINAQPDLTLPIHEAIFWRGLFLHRYSGVEHAVTELLLRSDGRDEYRSSNGLPYPWPRKLQRLAKILNTAGPLEVYAADIRELLIPFTSIERHRHMLTHGMMGCNVRGVDPRGLYFKSHDRIHGELGEITLEITIDELIGMTQDLGPIAQKFTKLISRIFKEIPLAPIQVADQKPLEIGPREI